MCIRHLSATYSGVWRGPSSPCFRRIDIKSYPLDLLPFAVTHFGSCSNFNRALRYYCKAGDARRVAQEAGLGEHFHLSDHGLVSSHFQP